MFSKLCFTHPTASHSPAGQYPSENICELKSCCLTCFPPNWWRSHCRTVLSNPPVHNFVPSGEISIHDAPSVCPWNVLKKGIKLHFGVKFQDFGSIFFRNLVKCLESNWMLLYQTFWVTFQNFGSNVMIWANLKTLGHISKLWVIFQNFVSNFRTVDQISWFWVKFQNCGSIFMILGQISELWVKFQNFGSNFKTLGHISKLWVKSQIFGSNF